MLQIGINGGFYFRAVGIEGVAITSQMTIEIGFKT